jgi:dihydropteroate synthase
VSAAIEAARAMSRAGAAVIDVGGQSTRPGSQRVSVEEELARVLPIIRWVCGTVVRPFGV